MKMKFLIFILCAFATTALSQTVYLNSSLNKLYKLEISNCNLAFIVDLESSLTDIALHPNGDFFGISNSGNLFAIDTLNGNFTFIHHFDIQQSFNSLTIAKNGVIYATGPEGALCSYNLITEMEIYHGDLGHAAEGDLLFSDGHLYASVGLIAPSRLLQVNIDTPSNSFVTIDHGLGPIYGLASTVKDYCGNTISYAITNSDSEVYQIKYLDNSVQFICDLGISVNGAAKSFMPPAPIIIEIVQATCDNNDGEMSVIPYGEIGEFLYSIDGENFHSSNYFSNLPMGNYTIYVKDSNNCTTTESVEISAAENPDFYILESVPATCNLDNGIIEVEGIAGSPPYSYSINGIDFQSSGMFNDLEPGYYTLEIRDSSYCTTSAEIHVDHDKAPVISNIVSVPTKCGKKDGKIQISTSGGSGIQYSINGIDFGPNNSFNNLSPGIYRIYVSDHTGCILSVDVRISNCPIFVPNIFSPNNDGINNSFKIYSNPDFKGKINSFRIFDRWGTLVYSAQRYSLNSEGWDGSFKGEKLGVGVYVYLIEIEYEDGEKQNITGDITLIY